MKLIIFWVFGPLGPFGTLGPYLFSYLGPLWALLGPLALISLGFWDMLGHFSKKCPNIGTFFDQLFLKKSTYHKVLGPSHYAKKMRIWILSISTFQYFFDFAPPS